MRYLVPLLLAVLTCISCSHTHDYSGYLPVNPEGWAYGDRLDFKVATAYNSDSVVRGNIYVSLTHDNNYEYNGLWLEVRYTPTGSNTQLVDTVHVEMCDDLGRWYGTGMPGYYQLIDTVTAVPVSIDTASVISVRHIMRVDTLPGISQVGISIR